MSSHRAPSESENISPSSGRRAALTNISNSSASRRKYVDHLEQQLADAQEQLSAAVSPSHQRTQSSTRMRYLNAEARRLQEEVAAWERKYEDRIREEMDRHFRFEEELRAKIRSLESEAEGAKFKVTELEMLLEEREENLGVAETANRSLEKRLELLGELLASSTSRIDLHADTPGRRSSRASRPGSTMMMVQPRFPTAGSLATSPVRTQPGSPRSPRRASVRFSPGLAPISPVHLSFSPEVASSPGEADEEGEDSEGSISLSSVIHAPNCATRRPMRRMRRFGAGSVRPKPLILPSTSHCEQIAIPAGRNLMEELEAVRTVSDGSLLMDGDSVPSSDPVVAREAAPSSDPVQPGSPMHHGDPIPPIDPIPPVDAISSPDQPPRSEASRHPGQSGQLQPDQQLILHTTPPPPPPPPPIASRTTTTTHSAAELSFVNSIFSPPRTVLPSISITRPPARPRLWFTENCVELARRLIRIAQSRLRIPRSLLTVRWWLVGILFGPMARKQRKSGLLRRGSRGEDDDDDGDDDDDDLAYGSHSPSSFPSSSLVSRTPDSPSSSAGGVGSGTRRMVVSGTGKKRKTLLEESRSSSPSPSPPHHHPHHSPGHPTKSRCKHSPILWLKFSMTLAIAVGVAFKDGPSSLLKEAVCSCRKRQKQLKQKKKQTRMYLGQGQGQGGGGANWRDARRDDYDDHDDGGDGDGDGVGRGLGG
ncbi:Hypothetical predicted protein [Lecanosticta acicola]|uniref:NUDE domain-containing protein n=1 Tax=Lecanosticta acicola TaxID=111012 RepID=A0AAI8Z748_9PEZI|nr:Hypothetical predicted protein [Lecanosticta acicola]